MSFDRGRDDVNRGSCPVLSALRLLTLRDALSQPLSANQSKAAVPIVQVTSASDARCVGWRQASGCGDADDKLKREPGNDDHCDVPIAAHRSGFCECRSGVTAALDRRRAYYNATNSTTIVTTVRWNSTVELTPFARCGHPRFNCSHICERVVRPAEGCVQTPQSCLLPLNLSGNATRYIRTHTTVTQAPSGAFSTSFGSSKAGLYHLHLTLPHPFLGPQAVAGSPFGLLVEAAAAFPASSLFFGRGVDGGFIDRVGADFRVQARDRYGNNRTRGGDALLVRSVGTQENEDEPGKPSAAAALTLLRGS